MLTPREATESNVKLSITVIVYMYIFTEIHENSVLTLGIILVTEMLYIDDLGLQTRETRFSAICKVARGAC